MQKAIILLVIILLLSAFYLFGGKFMSSEIYFDNNATMPPLSGAIEYARRAAHYGNPSASHSKARAVLAEIRAEIERLTGRRVIFTSGASESNALALRGLTIGRAGAHIITSQTEHNSILECCAALEKLGVEVTYLKPKRGIVDVADVEGAIRPNTVLISIMHGNNETGFINPITEIANLARTRGIHYHTDATQTFGKFEHVFPADAISMSFHKLGGIMGSGMLLVTDNVLEILTPQINGSQNGGKRGGTENVPGIAAGFYALREAIEGRAKCVEKYRRMRAFIKEELDRDFHTVNVTRYVEEPPSGKSIAFFDSPEQMPNTLMLSVVNADAKFCNVRLKKDLAMFGIYTSIGSACNTDKAGPSHVLTAMDLPYVVRCGVLRISFGPENTLAECRRFVRVFLWCLRAQGVRADS